MYCYSNNTIYKIYQISTAKNGVGEKIDSGCTPRGWHYIYSRIGLNTPINSVFVARKWTREIYTRSLAVKFPNRDWILSRILQLCGLEPGKNIGGKVDTLNRYIYIHGTPDCEDLNQPNSHGCIRLNNRDVVELANWGELNTRVYIK